MELQGVSIIPKWPVTISGDKVIAGRVAPSFWNPLALNQIDEPGLHLTFASVDSEEDQSIKTFAEANGLLGLAVHHAWHWTLEGDEEKKTPPIDWPHYLNDPSPESTLELTGRAVIWEHGNQDELWESVQEWREEIRVMKTIVELQRFLHAPEKYSEKEFRLLEAAAIRTLGYRPAGHEMAAELFAAAQMGLPDTSITGVDEDFYSHKKLWPIHPLVQLAPRLIQDQMHRRLVLVRPYLAQNVAHQSPWPQLVPAWWVPTLLSAMYLQLWGELGQIGRYRRCAHVPCSRYFVAQDERQIYCCREHSNYARVWRSRHQSDV